MLNRARTMLTVELAEDAGRAAYLVGYHAAEALIVERIGKATKTHKGVHTTFARVAMNDPEIDVELRRFLPRAHDLKAICDYGLGPDEVVPLQKAASAVDEAARFLDCIARLVERPVATP